MYIYRYHHISPIQTDSRWFFPMFSHGSSISWGNTWSLGKPRGVSICLVTSPGYPHWICPKICWVKSSKASFKDDMSFPTLSHLKNPPSRTHPHGPHVFPSHFTQQNMAQHPQLSQPSQLSWRQRRSSPCCRASYHADPSAMPPRSFRGRPAWCRAGRLWSRGVPSAAWPAPSDEERMWLVWKIILLW